MPFIPHTKEEIQKMLETIGVSQIDELFDEIPQELRAEKLRSISQSMSEMQISAHMKEQAAKDSSLKCFAGAGAYDHYIPAVIWDIALRGEYYSAYTPYQAEASQGTLQVLYEYQTMMSRLTAMDVSNASLYDGASALAEAILMAVRVNRRSKSRRILVPKTVSPVYRNVIRSIVSMQDIEIIEVPFDLETGITTLNFFEKYVQDDITAVVIPQPNFFGVLEDVNALTNWAHDNGAIAIGLVNPVSLAVLSPPGEWGVDGVDIACGEGQPLGIPLSSGGPYFGFMCCKKKIVRQLPGRIIGKTVDASNNPGYVLTLQAREQHIRRSKATSNICTNQGLMVTVATMYMALLGPEGLKSVALKSMQNTGEFTQKVVECTEVDVVFQSQRFHEVVLRINSSAEETLNQFAKNGILAGISLEQDYPELGNSLLVCLTETKTERDIEQYIGQLRKCL